MLNPKTFMYGYYEGLKMDKLKCDVCNGNIVMQTGGHLAICDCCGMRYSRERILEKVQETSKIDRTKTATPTDQHYSNSNFIPWHSLIEKYYASGDFLSAEEIVKKILEVKPTDQRANQQYDELQILKYIEIKNGTLIKYNGFAEIITIPDCVNEINCEAFKNCSSIKCINIPSGTVAIGDYAFAECHSLQTVQIPESVRKLGEGIFRGCSSLQSVCIPSGVQVIKANTFSGCKSLQTVQIPESVLEIGEHAFCACLSLQSIQIPKSIKKIAPGTFEGCSSLQNFQIPEDIVEIGASAFNGCTSLQSIQLPKKITTIKAGTFCNCSSLKAINVPHGVVGIDESAFKACKFLQTVYIPESVKYIKDEAFADCNNLNLVTMPERLLRVESFANSTELYYLRELTDPTGWFPPVYNQLRHQFEEEKKRAMAAKLDIIRKQEAVLEEKRRQELINQAIRWRMANRCQYCGGSFTGIFLRKCNMCGKAKDY